MKAWLRAATVAVVLSAGLSAAQAQVLPQAPARAPDAPQPKAAPVKRQTPVPLPPLPADPTLDMQTGPDNTKRIGPYLNDPKVGGADCRTQCSSVYYVCLSNNEDATQCGPAWSQCLTACPAHSSNF